MVQPNPTPVVVDPVAQAGPYNSPKNGLCAQGHPVNGSGRCQPLNDGIEQPTGPVVVNPAPTRTV